MPKVFVSYSWEDEKHKNWVKAFVDQLLENGIDAILDQYDLSLGDRLPQFMEQSIENSDYVLIVCTPTYKQKSDKRKGGVGYEGHIISDELLTKGNERKFIPVIRKGTAIDALPKFLSGKLGILLVDGIEYDKNFKELIAALWGEKRKPQIGEKPVHVRDSSSIENDENEPIRILGVITDEVTVPKMDGTRGSALYRIPFRLSRRPSSLWAQIFIQTWNYPPSFSTMHRPGIASVFLDEIVLDGTTIEEVRDYHGKTLKACVEIANKKEAEFLKEEKRKKINEEKRRSQHYSNVEKLAKEIDF